MKSALKDYRILFGFALLLASVAILFTTLGYSRDILIWTTLGEGVFLILIFILYITQFHHIKQMKQKRDEDVELLRNRLAALEACADGIAIVDKDGVLTYMNKAMMDVHAIRRANEYIGHNWDKLFRQKGQEDVDLYVIPALDQLGYWRGETPVIRADGEALMVDLSFSKTPEGGVICTARDVSAQRQAEQEREDMEQQFYQAQKMEAIGRLAGGIAHDFNNILAAMNGYAEFLLEDLKPETEQHSFAMKILSAGRQAKDLVDQMLAFSRQKQTTKEPLDLLLPVQESLSLLQASLPKTISVEAHYDLPKAPIDGNETQISQILMNLVVNASDAMEENGHLTVHVKRADIPTFEPRFLSDELPDTQQNPQIIIEDVSAAKTRLFLSHIKRGQGYVLLSVADTGDGMSRTIMEHIFEPFFTTKAVDKGTGLGLATVHGVIAGHKGAMIVESTLGQGTRFDLYFPIAVGVELPSADENNDVDDIDIHDEGVAQILLVEDEEAVRDMMMRSLKRLGYEAESCDNGLDALQIIKENPGAFDLVITDQNMPKMTGLEMIQQVQIFGLEQKFIMLSGYSQERLQELMRENPLIKAGLRKPVSKNVLREKIKMVLSQAA